jgi:dihydroorotate dehydrogenase electron transfer subunit
MEPQPALPRPAAFFQGPAAVLDNRQLARATYLIRLAVPELARVIRPGQFLMLRLMGGSDPLLGRPFALYDVFDEQGQPAGVDLVYLVVGKLTGRLAELRAGDRVEVWGPLGNGFPEPAAEHVGLVAGGIGQTPFLAYVRQLLGQRGYGGRPTCRSAQRVSLYYGVRSADLLAGVEDFRAAGAEVHLATEDGSRGRRGFVTSLVEAHLGGPDPPGHLVGCGPEPMLRALAALARKWKLPCHLSLESPMACGIGICFSCVTRVRTADGGDYRRICVEGPIFDADCLTWQ